MDTCLWRPVCWFRVGGATDRTLDRLSGLEDDEVMPHWLESMHSAMPIVFTDTTEIRESNQTEFTLYERLDVKAILASPFSPTSTGFLVERSAGSAVHLRICPSSCACSAECHGT